MTPKGLSTEEYLLSSRNFRGNNYTTEIFFCWQINNPFRNFVVSTKKDIVVLTMLKNNLAQKLGWISN